MRSAPREEDGYRGIGWCSKNCHTSAVPSKPTLPVDRSSRGQDAGTYVITPEAVASTG